MKKVKISALLLVLAMAVASITGCGSDTENNGNTQNESKQEEKVKTDEELVNETVTAYLKAISAVNSEDASKYVKTDSEIYSYVSNMNEYVIQAMMSGMGDSFDGLSALGINEESFKTKLEGIYTGIMNRMTTTSDKVTVSGNEATVTITANIPFPKQEDFSEDKVMKLMQEKMQKYSTQEELLANLEDMIIELVTDIVQNAEPTSQSGDITLEKVDGKWLVADDKIMF